MTRRTHDYTTHDTTEEITPGTRRVPAERVSAGLHRLDEQTAALVADRPGFNDDSGWAGYCAVMALLAARRAGWWGLLATACTADPTVPYVHALAAWTARGQARRDARFYRETAQEYRARIEDGLHPAAVTR